MLNFIQKHACEDWPAESGRNHDKYLDQAALDTHDAPPPRKRERHGVERL